MRFFYLVSLLGCCWVAPAQSILSIAQARALQDGVSVTVRGRVLGDAQFGRLRFVEDATGGLGIFPGTGSTPTYEAQEFGWGDSIEITGTLSTFRGLRQISPVVNARRLGTGLVLTPRRVRVQDLQEGNEGRLVTLTCGALNTVDSTIWANKRYDFVDTRGQTAQFSYTPESSSVGKAFPQGPVTLVGVVNQSDTYFLQVRTMQGSGEGCLQFTEAPAWVGHSTQSLTLRWATTNTAKSWLRYGLGPDAVGLVRSMPEAAQQVVTLEGLQPATIYWTQVVSVTGRDTLWSSIRPFVTQSTSSGKVAVYFTRPLLPNGPRAAGESPQAAVDAIVARLDAARTSIDVAMYNVNLSVFVEALKRAHARGVRVRYVAAADTRSLALQPPPPFPVVYGNDVALMHNKFAVIDRDDAQGAWVLSGSLNWTQGNVFDDANNAVWIQDQALARVYTLEFEEMWREGRFGSDKLDNTPHELTIGGKRVLSYFSPSDRPTDRLVQALRTAQASADFALLTFTKDEPAATLVALQRRGVQVRGMIENILDSGSEFAYLRSNQVPVVAHTLSGILHHKYAVVDARRADSDPLVWTGSHNWSASADQRNDENSLVLYDAEVAALFQSEFDARWQEMRVLSTTAVGDFSGKIWPNPAQDAVHLTFPQGKTGVVTFYNAVGQVVLRQTVQRSPLTVVTSEWPTGLYHVCWLSEGRPQKALLSVLH